MLTGVPLAGAERRLVSAPVPPLAVTVIGLALTAGWLLLAVTPEAALTVTGGPGPGLAALHLLTLGVLGMAVVLVVPQILPVVTMVPAPALPVLIPVHLGVAGGAVTLVTGFLSGDSLWMAAGATTVAGGLGLFCLLWARLLWQARHSGMGDLLLANSLALLCMLLIAALGVSLSLDYRTGFLSDSPLEHGALVWAHAILAVHGLMGLLVMGYSTVLIPMLAVAEPQGRRANRPLILLYAAGVLTAAFSAAVSADVIGWLGWATALLAVGLFLRGMLTVLKRRLRRSLGPSFWLIRLSWGLWAAGLLAGAGARIGWLSPELAGALLLPGWLLTLLLGILQRIIPFLASMHSVRCCARPAPLPRFENCRQTAALSLAHAGAVLLLTAGIALGSPLLIRGAAGMGLLSGLLLLFFAAGVFTRLLSHRRAVGPRCPRPAPSSFAS